MATPAFDHDLRLGQRVEDLAVEEFVPKSGVEALAVAVLPWAAGLDERGFGTHGDDPLSHFLGDKFRPIVRAYMVGHAAQDDRSVKASTTLVESSFLIAWSKSAFAEQRMIERIAISQGLKALESSISKSFTLVVPGMS